MKVAVYTRESDDDTTKAPPIEKQIERGNQWVSENNHELMIIYKDDGYSGGDWKRPAWNQSVNDAKRHLFQAIWVWNQDRLARDTEQFLWYCRNLKEAHVKIWEDTSNDWIDMETLGGRVKHQSLAQASEIFRLVTSEKVKKAYQRKQQEAQKQELQHFWGRKPINLPLEEIKGLKAQGLSLRAIAGRYSVSFLTIRNKLKNTHKKNHISETLKTEELKNNPIS